MGLLFIIDDVVVFLPQGVSLCGARTFPNGKWLMSYIVQHADHATIVRPFETWHVSI